MSRDSASFRVGSSPVPNRFRSLLLGAPPPRPLLFAHRGDSAHAPENTREAARLGREAGADAWEIDVQQTRDGVLVVIHDESLARTTDVATRFAGDPRGESGFLVSDFDFDEVRALDAGSWFLAPGGKPRTASAFGTLDGLDGRRREEYASGSVRVPSLAEALRLTLELDWLVNVEIKSFPNPTPGLVEAVSEEVAETGTVDRVLISSFDHADVARAATLLPGASSGVLAANPVHRPAEYVRGLVGADFYHPSTVVLGEASDRYRRRPSAGSLRVADLDALRAGGVPVLAYTVNDIRREGLAMHLATAGVVGLFTDVPGRMRRLFDGLPPRGPGIK